MLSVKALNPFAKEILGERIKQSTDAILQDLEANEKPINNKILEMFDSIFKKCCDMQRLELKGCIAYIHLFYLKAALFTETYEIQINLFDKNSYGDKQECVGFWMPDFIMKHFMKDMAYFEVEAKKHILYFGYAELQQIKFKYYDIYLGLIGQFLLKTTGSIQELTAYSEMKKEKDVIIIFGGYMDKGIQLYPPLEVTVCDTIL